MKTVELPDYWLLIEPCGCVDGARHSVLGGQVVTATAEDAWEKFTRLKRDRDREVREGWICRGGVADEIGFRCAEHANASTGGKPSSAATADGA